MGFCAVEGAEEGRDCLFVGLGLGSEARFIDAVVDLVVSPLVRLLDLGFQIVGQEVEGGILLGK